MAYCLTKIAISPSTHFRIHRHVTSREFAEYGYWPRYRSHCAITAPKNQILNQPLRPLFLKEHWRWVSDTVLFQAACDSFGVKEEAANKVVSESLKNMATGWNPGHYRWVEDQRKAMDPCASKFMRGRYIKLAFYVRSSLNWTSRSRKNVRFISTLAMSFHVLR